VENFGWNFSANTYSEPASMALSSSAMVTAAEKVQKIDRLRKRLTENFIDERGPQGGQEQFRRNIDPL
jgi:hypothetical protein